MAHSSRRSARAPHRGGLTNALFVVAAAEHPPVELAGMVDELTITFPWGSLLRGALALDDAAAAGIAALLRRGGCASALVSVTERDGLAMPNLDELSCELLAARWAGHGLRLDAFGPAAAAEIEAVGSSWARRLSVGRSRPAWRLALASDVSGRPR